MHIHSHSQDLLVSTDTNLCGLHRLVIEPHSACVCVLCLCFLRSDSHCISQYYDSDEDENQLDLPLALSTGPNWNHNVPLPKSMLKVINTSFDPEEPSNVKVIFNREDAVTQFQIMEKYQALATDAEVPSSFKELKIKLRLVIIVQLFI